LSGPRSGRRRGMGCGWRRCRPGWTCNGRGPGRAGRRGGCEGGGRRRGVITGPSAAGDHGDDDGGDDDDGDHGGRYPPAAGLLMRTIAVRPACAVPVALHLKVAARVGVPAGGLRRAWRLAGAGASGLLGPGTAVPVALAGGRIVRICVPSRLSPFGQVNSSRIAARPPPASRARCSWRGMEGGRVSPGSSRQGPVFP
jgi:hypothetical protein